MMNLMPIPQNYKNSVDWILGAYSDAGVSFPDGFQKDAIQNAAGARKTHKWNGWHCDISHIRNEKGEYIVVEDSGTVGLTGHNIPVEEVNKMMAESKSLAPDERLARFSSLFNSGGNTTGAGLYGAGKSVYSVASRKYTYYFDSLRQDQKYVANINAKGQVLERALEGNEAKNFIYEKTGLSPKTTIGTRVIIDSPKKELVDSLYDGTIISFIQESWWLIIQRLTKDAAITINGQPVPMPENIKNTPKAFELQNPEQCSPGYPFKVKHFGLYVFDDGSNKWSGISYYRKGMKIGDIDIKNIPEKVKDKFWGYMEVDEQWEKELAEIEDKVHFGVSKGKKKTLTYQQMKNYCATKFRNNMIAWGYIKDQENEDKKLKDAVNSIREEIENLADKLHFEDLGKGPQKPDFDVRWQDIHYPVSDSEKVTTDDVISFSARIKNSYTVDKKFDYTLTVIDPGTGSIVSKIAEGRVAIPYNAAKRIDFRHKVTKKNSIEFAENRITLKVKVIGSGKEKTKNLPFYYDIEPQKDQKQMVGLTLHECVFPVQGSRRVNFGESVSKVCWKIENKRNHTLNYRLNISIHNASDKACPKIVDITSFTGTILPFEDSITPYVEEIVFDREKYEQFLSEGILELRARLVANADDPLYEKGDKITFYYFKIFLNTDEKNGKSDSFEVQLSNAPKRYERSWRTPGNGRTITLNIGHPAYTNLSDYPDLQMDYLREQMLKQFVLLYLDEGKYDMFGEEFSELEPQEAADKVIQKIDSVYYESLK